ncbi:cysteine protease family C01A [Achlya hypogyna]|uniref:Cysteine protease family C01A n=1 Tax=Achlya hypogyna TaxID=1202772 RepID=A0A0A7CNB1_ACHHY|nr:secreted protein [Achlya hypogyna]OQR89653.1 cysteine protease family C01A [Achlya hypogyna]
MQPSTALLFALAAPAAALTASERADLTSELDMWKASEAGKIAAQEGFMPSVRGLVGAAAEEVELVRFQATKATVAQLNKDHPDATFTLDNPWVLLTDDEFAAFVRGGAGGRLATESNTTSVDLTAAQLEAGDKDWTGHKCLSPVRNQGTCGSCWAFAATGAVESAHCLATGTLMDFSEQQLVSCAHNAGHGCGGGWPSRALDFVFNTGFCTDVSFPYTGRDDACRSCEKTKVAVGPTVNVRGEGALQTAIDAQPASVMVEAANGVWRNYNSGVVRRCPGAQSDHVVLAVGYGSKGGVDHFKIKNSWGSRWGEGGYMYLERGGGGRGMCNVADSVSYPKLQSKPTPNPSPKPKPTKKPSPTPSKDVCADCSGCYYPAKRQCLEDDERYDEDFCTHNADVFGTVWCGPSN